MNVQPQISIIIPVRNEGNRLKEAIRSFVYGRSKVFALEFIIVDDASTDGCCDNIESLIPDPGTGVSVRKVTLRKWSGIPYARNTGAQYASARVLLITDANVSAEPGWDIPVFTHTGPGVALCATIADQTSDWRGYGCMLMVPSMGVQWLNDPGIFNEYAPVMPCAGTVIDAGLFAKLGGYDTAMPVYGAAEAEFSVRLWLYGAVIKKVPELVLSHHFKVGEERSSFMDKIKRIQVKNYLRFGLLYLNEDLIRKMFEHWSAQQPGFFEQVHDEIDMVEIFNRRAQLQRALKYNFKWYSNVFAINHLAHI